MSFPIVLFVISRHPSLSNVPGLLVTIGTGLGSGIINSAGELERGAHGLGGELGHVSIRFPLSSVDLLAEEIACGCQRIGCAEQYTTLSFIERELVAALKQDPTHKLAQFEDPREAAKRVLSLAMEGDQLSLKIILDQGVNLGKFLADQITGMDPGWVLIGGGITEASDALRGRYLETVVTEIEKQTNKNAMERVLLDYATLGDNAGWVGATISAADYLRSC